MGSKIRVVRIIDRLNIGGPAEFGVSIEEQRAKIAMFAKELGIKSSQ